ncbi:MAG: CDP-alcohol phosphatidyltransferase family protein [Candidatus Omnitrophota bacterium]|nr:CDP-alcohol phosphatidyltransferase family protein [Candidatus Omnitrophota bacterium]
MVENLKDLNAICQKKDYKTKGNWMARHITRDMALVLSWLLLHTPITANQVTLFSLVAGGLGCVMFAHGSKVAMAVGAILLQLWYLLDHVDGQIARYRKQVTLTGVYFDYVSHYLIHIGIFFGIGYGIFASSGNLFYFIMGITAGMGVTFLNLIYDVQYKAYFSKIIKLDVIFLKRGQEEESQTKSKHVYENILKGIFSFLHKLCEVHVLMNIITFIAVFSLFINFYPWKIFIIIYAIFTVFVTTAKNVYFVLSRIPDKSFNKTFSIRE